MNQERLIFILPGRDVALRTWYAVVLLLIVYFALHGSKFSSLMFDAEPWAEAGANYYKFASEHSFYENLNKDDAGYLPLPQRLISYALVKAGVRQSFPLVTQLLAQLFIAAASVMIVLPVFRRLIENDWLRVLLAIAIGGIPDYELHTFINFSYFGIVPCLLIASVDVNALRQKFYVPALLGIMLILCSKGLFVIFLLPYFVLALYYWRRKKGRAALFFLMLSLAAAIQLVYSLRHASHVTPDSNISIFALADKTAYVLWLVSGKFLFAEYASPLYAFGAARVVFGILVILFVALCWKWYRSNPYKCWLSVFLLYIAASSLLVGVLTGYSPERDLYTLAWDRYADLPVLRWFLFAMVSVFLLVLLILDAFSPPWKKLSTMIAMIQVFFFSIYPMWSAEDHYSNRSSDWQAFKFMLNAPDYYIPINPSPEWSFNKNCILEKSPGKYPLKAILVMNAPSKLDYVQLKGSRSIELRKLKTKALIFQYFYLENPMTVDSVFFLTEKNDRILVPEENVFYCIKK